MEINFSQKLVKSLAVGVEIFSLNTFFRDENNSTLNVANPGVNLC